MTLATFPSLECDWNSGCNCIIRRVRLGQKLLSIVSLSLRLLTSLHRRYNR